MTCISALRRLMIRNSPTRIRKIDESSMTKGAWGSAGFISEVSNRQAQRENPKQDRHHEADEGLHLAVVVGAGAQPEQQGGERDPLQRDVAGRQQTGAPAEPALMHDQRHEPEQDALERKPADAGADPAGAEQREAAQ